ncbi:MAG: response regulator, partial [Deltaproteobacteria bacterium]|nr:response regulator [Deltaproteobacteria bacterium]
MIDDRPQPERILIVDDDPVILEIIEVFLQEEGYAVISAAGGAQALGLINEVDFDLIITDLSMPEINGFKVMAAAGVIQAETPVITFTGQGTLDNAIQAIKLGAYDFVTKPIKNLSVFLVTIRRALEKKRLLKKQRAYVEQIERQNRALLQDLSAARYIQACMIDHDFGLARRHLDIVTRYLPAETVGGDFYDVFFLPPHFIAFYVADVSGHGVTAAMVTAFAKQALIKITEKAAEPGRADSPDPKEILTRFNQELIAQGFKRDGVPIYL